MAVSLTLRRNRYLIPLCIVLLLILIYFWDRRVISVNIWDKWEVTTDYYDIENTIDLFDTTQVHEISINMTDEEYKDMIDTYASTSEKDWYKTDITIDWVTVYNVGVRLKGNSSLKWIGWNWQWGPWWSKSWMDRWMWRHREGMQDNRMMGFHWNRIGSWNRQRFPWENGSWEMQRPEVFQGWSFWAWAMSWDSINYNTQLPLFVKFDKYEDQTYQWHEMISLRVWGMGSDTTLLAEPYSYELYQEAWQPAPDTVYWAVKIDWMDEKLFIISELPEDEYYITKWFWDDNGVLYKAGNFIDFGYQWEDPTVYSEYFTQKTRVNDYDLSLLIKLLKFVSQSSDEEFSEHINDYIDIKSVLTVLAIDDFVWNQDSFGGMWSNYYLYYHLWEQKFYLLTWDQNLALGWMWWGRGWMWGDNWSWWMMGWFGWWMWFWMRWWMMSWENGNQMSWNIQESWFDFGWFPWTFNSEWMSWEMQWWMLWMLWFPWWEMEMWSWWMWWNTRGMWWRNGNNELKTRLLANDEFKAMYDEIYAEIKRIALDTDFSENFLTTWTNALLKYNEDSEIVSEENYLKAVESIKSKIEEKRN